MFETHKELEEATKKFLVGLAQKRGWDAPTPANNPKRGFVEVWKDGILIFNAMDYSQKSHIEITISLIPHSRVVTYLVSRFLIEPRVVLELLDEQDVFTHHGKYLALGRGDSTNPLHGNLWEINCPANLEALFRAYDNLARLRSAMTIFNLP